MQLDEPEISLHVSIRRQTLTVLHVGGSVLRTFPVSTSQYGLGSEPGSLRTPLGRFRIIEKIGDGAELGTVFKSRVPTRENGLGASGADLVLTRILWLDGLDPENSNTYERYIYIHGTNQEHLLGQPASHGCVRMANADVVALYEMIPSGAEVRITKT